MRVFVALFVLAFVPLVLHAQGTPAPKEWSLFVFMNGDNDLDPDSLNDLNEMEKVGSSDQINIVVQHDRFGITGTKRYLIRKDNDPATVTSPVVQDMPECDMGNWEEALAFFKWGTTNYPAKRFMCVIWDHGAGWMKRGKGRDILFKGISFDDTSGTKITTSQLGLLGRAIVNHIGRKIDIIAYDACLMQMAETAYEMKDSAVVQVGSEQIEPAGGWPYDNVLTSLVAHPTMEERDLARVLVQAFVSSYNGGSQGTLSVCLSAIDLTKFDAFVEKVNAFADALANNAAYDTVISKCLMSTQTYFRDVYRDLVDFAVRITTDLSVPELRTTGNELVRFLRDEFVIRSAFTGQDLKGSNGLSIHLPPRKGFEQLRTLYAGLSWAKNTRWGQFLEGLYHPTVPVLVVKGITYEDEDGSINPGDEGLLKVTILNEGSTDSAPVSVSIESRSPEATVFGGPVTVDKVPASSLILSDGVKVKVKATCPVDTELTFVAKVVDAQGRAFSGETKISVKRPFQSKNRVLLVVSNDDENEATFHMESLREAGIAYDSYCIGYYGSPTPGLFKNYVNGIVIVTSSSVDRINQGRLDDLAAYLDKGGSLLISGQDIANRLSNADSSFLKDYLHAKFVRDDSESKEVVGQGLLAGVSGGIVSSDGSNGQVFPDEIDPISPATVIFKYTYSGRGERSSSGRKSAGDSASGNGGSETAAVAVQTPTYKVVFCAFGIDELASAAARTSVISKALEFLKPTGRDRVRGLAAVAEKSRRLDESRGSSAYSTARTEESEWIDRTSAVLQMKELGTVRRESLPDPLKRSLIRKVTFESLAR